MKCPKCDALLLMTDRQGVEIDYCPQCRGIWLDRGELEKIIDRSVVTNQGHESGPSHQAMGFGSGYHDHDRYKDHDHHDYHGQRRKKGFLGELFDF